VIAGLQEQVSMLQYQLDCLKDESTTYYANSKQPLSSRRH
jgi:hypothetical protein